MKSRRTFLSCVVIFGILCPCFASRPYLRPSKSERVRERSEQLDNPNLNEFYPSVKKGKGKEKAYWEDDLSNDDEDLNLEDDFDDDPYAVWDFENNPFEENDPW